MIHTLAAGAQLPAAAIVEVLHCSCVGRAEVRKLASRCLNPNRNWTAPVRERSMEHIVHYVARRWRSLLHALNVPTL